MKIKKYRASTFAEAFDQMKRELGPDAIILNSRQITAENTLDFAESGGAHYEITAAIDQGGTVRVGRPSQASGFDRLETRDEALQPEKQEQRPPTPTQPAVSQQPSKPEGDAQQLRLMKHEMRDMKRMLGEVSEFLRQSRMPALPAIFKNEMKHLLEVDVNEELARGLVQTAYAHVQPGQYTDSVVVRKQLEKLVNKIINKAYVTAQPQRHPEVIMLVGPTGVGKTTTVAKLAAINKLFHHKSVALISADTYRIAAIEQLQTFANIANIPLSVAYTPEEMSTAISQYRSKDVILIDTVGRNQKNSEQIDELQRFVNAANPNQVHLVMGMTASLRSLFDIINRFRGLQPTHYLFSKLDESDSPGNILNILYKKPRPVSYITIGQTVPNDIVKADADQLCSLIFEGEPVHA